MDQSRHILIIHTDAQMHRWLGAAGNDEIATPNLDRLAADGTMFRQAYAASGVCVPSRCSLFTGRYPIAHGVANNFSTLHANEPSMGHHFAEAGYDTGYFGKTHMGRSAADDGWRSRFLVGDYKQYLEDNGINATYPKQQLPEKRTRYWNVGRSPIPSEHYFENVVTDRAIDFLQMPRSNPFLCFVSYVAPHGPFTPPAPYDRMYDPQSLTLEPRTEDELAGRPPETVRWITQNQKYLNEDELRETLAAMYGLISLVDDNVGRLIETLKSQGLYERTLIVFASDHGDYGTRYGIIGKSWSMNDELLRIPLIVSCPGWRDGHASNALVQNIDIHPTLLEYAGLEAPVKMQGRSLLPLMRGEVDRVRDAAFAYQQNEYSGGQLFSSMIRTPRWKFVASGEDREELYDMDADPMERRNLARDAEHAEQAQAMRNKLLHWHIEQSGHFYHTQGADYWEDRTAFYDETRFGRADAKA